MKKEHLDEANEIAQGIANCEEFISNCDHIIRNMNPKEHPPSIDRYIRDALAAHVITHEDLRMLLVDLRDIATVKLEDLDKRLEAL